MRYADPLAQAEIDRLARSVEQLDTERLRLLGEMAKVSACSDPTPPADGERATAEQLWHHLLEASSHRRLYVLNQFLEAQDDALRCYMTHGLGLP